MTLSLRMAWRNLWRNKRRTWLTATAMAFSNVLLVFMITTLHHRGGRDRTRRIRFLGPLVVLAVLLVEGVLLFTTDVQVPVQEIDPVGPKVVGELLFGRYLLLVEATALLLMAALTAVLHLSRKAEEDT